MTLSWGVSFVIVTIINYSGWYFWRTSFLVAFTDKWNGVHQDHLLVAFLGLLDLGERNEVFLFLLLRQIHLYLNHFVGFTIEIWLSNEWV